MLLRGAKGHAVARDACQPVETGAALNQAVGAGCNDGRVCDAALFEGQFAGLDQVRESGKVETRGSAIQEFVWKTREICRRRWLTG